MLLWVIVRLNKSSTNNALVLARNAACYTLLSVLKLVLWEMAYTLAWVSSDHIDAYKVAVCKVVWEVLDLLRDASMVACVAQFCTPWCVAWKLLD